MMVKDKEQFFLQKQHLMFFSKSTSELCQFFSFHSYFE